MPPSLYSRMPPETKRKFIRYLVIEGILTVIGFGLYAVRKKHFALEVVMVAIMFGAIVFAVKFLKLITAAANELENEVDDDEDDLET